MTNRTVVISHIADLDGVTSATIAHFYLKRLHHEAPKVAFCDYDNAEQVITLEADLANEIWITDLSFSNPLFLENLIKFNPSKNFYIFDHHVSSKEAMERVYDKATVGFEYDGSFCAADLLYQYCAAHSGPFPQPLRDLVAFAHSRDLWIRNLKEGDLLTDVISALGAEKTFNHICQDYNYVYKENFTELMTLAVDIANRSREESIKLARATVLVKSIDKTKNDDTLIVCFCYGACSDIGDTFLKEHPDKNVWVAMVDLSKLTVSFRTRQSVVDATGIAVNAIAAGFGGGGHACAAGGKTVSGIFDNGLEELSSRIAGRFEELGYYKVKNKK